MELALGEQWNIESLVTVLDQPDKHGIGYAYFSRGRITEKALAIVLNKSKLLVSKALAKADAAAVSFYYALLVTECCVLRRIESPLVGRFQDALSGPLYARWRAPALSKAGFVPRRTHQQTIASRWLSQ
jgi:hypothetical protein